MTKVALLVGVSDYPQGLSPLPSTLKDIVAMQQVLENGTMGNFDKIQTLENPDPLALQEAIEILFSSRKRDDLALLFFSGHGIKDDRGRLYFATRLTRKNSKGELVKATAVPASFLHDIMGNSRCKRQVVILDCCFSGAIAEGMQAKDDGAVDVKAQLGGQGRAVLTSSSSTQYSFEQADNALSVYTRFIVEGIQTGAADTDNDGLISIEELHDYASAKVQEVAPAMKPKIYAVEEGFRIRLAQAPINDPKLRYRKEANQFASRGEISAIGRSTLDILRQNLGIPEAEAVAIETEVLQPYQEYQQHLQQYTTALTQALEQETPLSDVTRQELKRFQQVLGLEDKDVAPIERRLLPPTIAPPPTLSPPPAVSPSSAAISSTTSTDEKSQSTAVASTAVTALDHSPAEAAPTPQRQQLPQKGILIGLGGLVGVGVLVGAIALLGPSEESPDSLDTDVAQSELPSDTEDSESVANRSLSSESRNSSGDNQDFGEIAPPPPDAEYYVDPEGMFELYAPNGYTIEHFEGSDTAFYSPETPLEGNIVVETTNSSLSKAELGNHIKNEPPFDTITWKADHCPDQEDYACLRWDGTDEEGNSISGESILKQEDDSLFLLELYSLNQKIRDYGKERNIFIQYFSPFFDLPKLK